MNCPVCKEPKLVISERQGIEIDYCPDCRGVWLDRGELDKIIQKSGLGETQRFDGPSQKSSYESHDRHYKRKKSFLEDIFD